MSHTKEELLNSKFKKGETRIGPGHDGVPRHFSKPGEPGLIAHPHAVAIVAGQKHETNVHADLGVAPKVKHAHQVASPIHSGMTVQTSGGGTAFGGDHRSAVDALTGVAIVPGKDGKAAVAHPLAKVPPGKNFPEINFSPGMRRRANDELSSGDPGAAHAAFTVEHRAALHELGRAVLREAVESGGWIKFPQATDENT